MSGRESQFTFLPVNCRIHEYQDYLNMSDNTEPKNYIRVRANLAVLDNKKRILLVPHFLENNEIIWYIPGGKVEFCESLENAAIREFKEETGLTGIVISLLDVSEIIEPEKPWHSISITFKGKVLRGKIIAENHHTYGRIKRPKWFSKEDLSEKKYRPIQAVKKILGIKQGQQKQ